jgi:hypothetical protein
MLSLEDMNNFEQHPTDAVSRETTHKLERLESVMAKLYRLFDDNMGYI